MSKTKPTAKVCHINGTNYVTYKGTRYTVKDYNKKFKTRVYIPKNVKVCEPVNENMLYSWVDDIEVPKLRKVEGCEKHGSSSMYMKCGTCEKRDKSCSFRNGVMFTLFALLIGTLLVIGYSR